MTRWEWLLCDDPRPMLEFLRGKVSERKLALFAVACLRQVWHLLIEECSRAAVEFAEQDADCPHERSERDAIGAVASDAAGDLAERYRQMNGGILGSQDDPFYRESWMYLRAANAATLAVSERSWGAALLVADRTAVAARLERGGIPESDRTAPRWRDVQRPQTHRLREIFGNPFRPVAFNPAWRSSDVQLLARGIYDERAFDRLPILADALQDAGCDCDDLLTHLRDTTSPHVRGCWALDLVLGKK